MNLNALDARDIRSGMKKGIGFDECLSKYNCTENDLIYHVRRLFVVDGDDIIKQLRKISKRNKADSMRRGKKSRKQSQAITANTAPIDSGNTPTPPPTEKSAPTPDPLTSLRAQEQSLSNTVIDLESEHKRLNSLHRNCLDQMRDIQGEIETIRKVLLEKGAAYEQTAQHNNQIIQNMNEISRRRSEHLGKLCEIRQEIESLTVVEVFVYTNGHIEAVDAETNISFNDAGNDELYAELIQRDDLQDLRMRDIRTLAKVIQVVRNSKTRVQPTFEDESLEPFFQTLVALTAQFPAQ